MPILNTALIWYQLSISSADSWRKVHVISSDEKAARDVGDSKTGTKQLWGVCGKPQSFPNEFRSVQGLGED